MHERTEKARIAVVIDSYTRGGVAMAAQVFLQYLAKEHCEITLFVRNYDPANMLSVPDGVDCRPWENGHTFSPLNRLQSLLHWRNFGRKAVYTARCRQMFSGEYDCAIGYQMVSNDVTVVTLEKIQAKRKILWLHGKKNFPKKDLSFYDNLYAKADRIVCVSLETESRFRSLMPKCAGKTITVHNLYDIPFIRSQAQATAEGMEKTPGAMTLVSVGRISKEKGFDRVAPVARKLLDAGHDIQWYIIGDGNKRSEVEADLRKENLEGYVHLLGHRKNPYPYIHNCDIYVQPSYTEGFCTSTMEAKILFKPVVTTDVPGMREQFVSGENGIIVESSVEGLFSGIKQLIDSPQLREKIVHSLHAEPISNETALHQTMDVIEGTDK